MKRKIVRHGPSSLTVSLPMKWAKQQGIKAGDEVEVIEEGDLLRIGSKSFVKKTEITADLSDSGVMLNRSMAAIYKAGYDQASISYKNAKEFEVIQDTIYRSCHTYEIMDTKDNNVKIKAISDLDPVDFNNILRKMAHAMIDSTSSTYNAMLTHDKDEYENIILRDRTIDRHSDFCRRIINKNHKLDHELIGPLYVIVEQTEIAADILKTICKELSKKQNKPNKDLLELYKDTDMMIKHFYEAFFKFDMERIKELGVMEMRIKDRIDEISKNIRSDVKLFAYFVNLFETVFEMKSALITLHIGKK